MTHTICHRLTALPWAPYALSVLQCGDPSGPAGAIRALVQGRTRLGEAQLAWFPDGSRKVYPRGTLAMANAGPGHHGDLPFSFMPTPRLRPDYTVFGTSARPA